MGYQTYFSGGFEVTPPLKPEHAAYLRKFNATRRMKRDANAVFVLPDPERIAAHLPIGEEGCYYTGSTASAGQDERTPENGILDYNCPPFRAKTTPKSFGTKARNSTPTWSGWSIWSSTS